MCLWETDLLFAYFFGVDKSAFKHKVDKKAMIKNRYNRTPPPALNTKRERDTYN